jgi:hypothetical protein
MAVKIVELIGLPGAGKTSTAERLRAVGRARVCIDPGSVLNARGAIGRISMFLKAPIFSSLMILCLGLRTGAVVDNYRRLLNVQMQYVVVRREYSKTDRLVVVDEGPMHSLFSCLFGTRTTLFSRFLLRLVVRQLMTCVDVFVLIDIEKESAVRRIRHRTHGASRFNSSTDRATVFRFIDDVTYHELLRTISTVRPSALLSCSSASEAFDQIMSRFVAMEMSQVS